MSDRAQSRVGQIGSVVGEVTFRPSDRGEVIVEFTRNGETRIITENVIETIQPGERAANKNPGGGGYGDPYEREIARVVEDVRNGLVSIEGARRELWRGHHRPGRADRGRGRDGAAAQLAMLLEGIDWRTPQRTWQPLAAG